ncbi:hypothetical protein PEC106568_07110 [Pectobacterium carotovorum subsp. carotovorum]|nr:hypothetical protein PEC106568_07110 [Pectobacterium carotovorum subsp. carotovorum]
MRYRLMRSVKLNKRRLMLLTLSLLLLGCSQQSENSSGNWQQVKQAAFPQLPQQARQKPRPQYCLPSCLANLTKQRESMQQQLTLLTEQD